MPDYPTNFPGAPINPSALNTELVPPISKVPGGVGNLFAGIFSGFLQGREQARQEYMDMQKLGMLAREQEHDFALDDDRLALDQKRLLVDAAYKQAQLGIQEQGLGIDLLNAQTAQALAGQQAWNLRTRTAEMLREMESNYQDEVYGSRLLGIPVPDRPPYLDVVPPLPGGSTGPSGDLFPQALRGPGRVLTSPQEIEAVSPYFGPDELRSKGNGDIKIDENALMALNEARVLFGAPIPLTSAYRDPAHNKAEGGATHSKHMEGTAFDLNMSGLNEEERVKLLESALAAGFVGIGFYGQDSDMLHVDTGPKRMWEWNGPMPDWAKGPMDNYWAKGLIPDIQAPAGAPTSIPLGTLRQEAQTQARQFLSQPPAALAAAPVVAQAPYSSLPFPQSPVSPTSYSAPASPYASREMTQEDMHNHYKALLKAYPLIKNEGTKRKIEAQIADYELRPEFIRVRNQNLVSAAAAGYMLTPYGSYTKDNGERISVHDVMVATVAAEDLPPLDEDTAKTLVDNMFTRFKANNFVLDKKPYEKIEELSGRAQLHDISLRAFLNLDNDQIWRDQLAPDIGPFDAAWNVIAGRIGGWKTMSDEALATDQDYKNVSSRYIKFMSGATVTDKEMVRLLDQMGNSARTQENFRFLARRFLADRMLDYQRDFEAIKSQYLFDYGHFDKTKYRNDHGVTDKRLYEILGVNPVAPLSGSSTGGMIAPPGLQGVSPGETITPEGEPFDYPESSTTTAKPNPVAFSFGLDENGNQIPLVKFDNGEWWTELNGQRVRIADENAIKRIEENQKEAN